ncbi:sodium:solute symporter family protein [Herbivorax sp. ANBcel31]|nr:sodium:solute symporter family protein [Herbivorax sp. ANBcel31]MDQ2086658.1 sodium:solute symporter family protein [Herbivorax sp. ANBcel31]
MAIKIVFLGLFAVSMIGIGIYSKKKVNNVQDFLFGGRQMGPWISAFSYGTAYFSAVIFIGYAGRSGWEHGISATWIGIGNAIIGCLLAWFVLAKRTRKMTHELNASTMPEFFEKRYNSKAIKIVTSIIIFFFLVPYSASVYQGLSYLFVTTIGDPLGISFEMCMLAMAVLTGVYLLLGGYVATAINDFIQGIIMIIGLLLMVFFVINHPNVGGLSEGISRLSTVPQIGDELTSTFGPNPINLISLIILTSVGAWGLPQMVHRFYAIRDEDAIKKGTIVSTVFATVIAGGAYFIGVFGRLFVDSSELMVGGRIAIDNVIPMMLERALPSYLMGIIIVLVLSASMSTLASLVLVSSSSISLDLIKGTFFKNMKKEKVMIVMRLLCAVFIALSYIVATIPSAILTLMSFSWGTVAGSFLAPFLYGLYWKGTTKSGAWAGIITGFSCSVGGAIIFGMNAAYAPNIGVVAMMASLVAVPVVSLVTAKLPKAHLENVFKLKKVDGELDIGA